MKQRLRGPCLFSGEKNKAFMSYKPKTLPVKTAQKKKNNQAYNAVTFQRDF